MNSVEDRKNEMKKKLKQTEKLNNFREYLEEEVKDIKDLQRFLAQLRESFL